MLCSLLTPLASSHLAGSFLHLGSTSKTSSRACQVGPNTLGLLPTCSFSVSSTQSWCRSLAFERVITASPQSLSTQLCFISSYSTFMSVPSNTDTGRVLHTAASTVMCTPFKCISTSAVGYCSTCLWTHQIVTSLDVDTLVSGINTARTIVLEHPVSRTMSSTGVVVPPCLCMSASFLYHAVVSQHGYP